MDLATITMPEAEAKAALKEYRDAVRKPVKQKLGEAQREYEELDRAVIRGYRALAKGQPLLHLSESLALGGTEEKTATTTNWTPDRGTVAREVTITLPKIAVCRADARSCWTRGVTNEGGVVFHANERPANRRANRVRVPDKTFPEPTGPALWSVWHGAMVPTVPPPLRPEHSLSGYHLLWEAEWDQTAPVDPALLKHLGGDLYAVLAVWDLTDLERAVLAGRTSD